VTGEPLTRGPAPRVARGVPGAPTFAYRERSLHCEEIAVQDLYRAVGPAYVYSARRLRENAQRTLKAFARAETLVAYAVKANTNPALLRLFYQLGLGFEVSSAAELSIALATGAAPAHLVVNGSARTDEELLEVAASGAYLVSVDSEAEAARLEQAATRLTRAGRLHAPVRAALRVNPDIDAHVHPDLATGIAESKFGLPPDLVADWYTHPERAPHLQWVGLHVHVGSQILDAAPLLDTLGECVDLIERIRSLGVPLSVLDLGGGFGVDYDGKESLAFERFADAACLVAASQGLRLVIEPGRYLVADACAMVGQVLSVKRTGRTFLVTELGMNDLIRPTLYDAHHEVVPVREPVPVSGGGAPGEKVDVVGPVCESGDYLARDRWLPPIAPGDLIAVTGAGAYGYSMASNYNGRGRLAEVLVDGDSARLIRQRESWRDIVRMASDLAVRVEPGAAEEIAAESSSTDAGAMAAASRPWVATGGASRTMAEAIAQGLRDRRHGPTRGARGVSGPAPGAQAPADAAAKGGAHTGNSKKKPPERSRRSR
jgi:diaminopimelate decarboxylase